MADDAVALPCLQATAAGNFTDKQVPEAIVSQRHLTQRESKDELL